MCNTSLHGECMSVFVRVRARVCVCLFERECVHVHLSCMQRVYVYATEA